MNRIPTNISLRELKFIIELYDKGLKQRIRSGGRPDKYHPDSIEGRVNRERRRLGIDKKVSTNTISRLSPKSKHRVKYEADVRSEWSYYEIPKFIGKCLRLSLVKAQDRYLTHILESNIAPFDFFDENQRNLVSIRFGYQDCKSPLYFAFTSEDYDWMEDHTETYKINPITGINELIVTEPEDHIDLWTVKTPYNYTDVITGRLPLERIQVWLNNMADGEYEPIFVNTLIYKKEVR